MLMADAERIHLERTIRRSTRTLAQGGRGGGALAAVEIIAGSFLHNLRMPPRGHVLSCIGAALLVASHRNGRKGLLWRAGLICAVMKSVSTERSDLAR